jgi:lipopolysaccharide/colanic/teichoic acid biosynthesis glycosyltransferase
MESIPIHPAKRVFDIAISTLLIALLLPVLLFLFILFAIESIFVPSSRGPFFYNETRVSQGRLFTLYKIRTFKMTALWRSNSKKNIIHTKELERESDNLTFTGKVARQTYMDELPQLFAVLKGDLSLVGPRPTNPIVYDRDIANGLQAKKIIRAGLTGKFQTHKHVKYKLNQEQVDMEYANFCKTKSSLQIILYDSFIISQTILTVLRAEGL